MTLIDSLRVFLLMTASLACAVVAATLLALIIRERRYPSYSYVFELLGSKLNFYKESDRAWVLAFRWSFYIAIPLVILHFFCSP
ncbi:hypothetical protein [Brevundimonas sp.]|uniref:hypothetical protein n=1 Tax=Brevundimonas sp. TaxID=1871086 RepID=UPI00289AE88D|nr:hypothetical protein [Brevundimonas sp.]